MKKLILFMLLMCSAQFALADSTEDLIKCVSALDAVAKEIEDSHDELSARLANGLKGAAMLRSGERGKIIELQQIKSGEVSDVSYCAYTDVDVGQINVLMKAYFGYLSEDPYDDLAKCVAGFLSNAESADAEFGAAKAQIIGMEIGKLIGKTNSTLNYLIIDGPRSMEDIMSTAQIKLKRLAMAGAREQEQTIESYLLLCEWYGVPVNKMLKSATIGAGA